MRVVEAILEQGPLGPRRRKEALLEKGGRFIIITRVESDAHIATCRAMGQVCPANVDTDIDHAFLTKEPSAVSRDRRDGTFVTLVSCPFVFFLDFVATMEPCS